MYPVLRRSFPVNDPTTIRALAALTLGLLLASASPAKDPPVAAKIPPKAGDDVQATGVPADTDEADPSDTPVNTRWVEVADDAVSDVGPEDVALLYDAGNRPDPFRPTADDPENTAPRWEDMRLTSVVQVNGKVIAMFEGAPDGAAVVVRVGELLGEAVVKKIDPATLSVHVIVRDASRLRGWRELRTTLEP